MTSPQHDTTEHLLAHGEFLRRIARRLLRRDDLAEDAVQDTWLAAMERPPRRGGSLRAWLTGVTRNLARQTQRGEARRERREQRIARREDAVPTPDEITARLEIERRLVEAVAGLTEPYRTTVLLRYFDDLSATEIAARMNVPLETVRTRLRRGVGQLREKLGGEEGDWRAALIPIAMPWGEKAVPAASGAMAWISGVWLVSVLKIGGLVGVVALGLIWVLTQEPEPERLETTPVERAEAEGEPTSAEPAADLPRPEERGSGDQAAEAEALPIEPERAKPPAASEAAAAQLVLELLCAEEPVCDATVWLTRDGRLLAENRSDERGLLHLAPFGGSGLAIVHARGRGPESVAVSLEAGHHVVELANVAEVSGRLVFEGGAPEEPVELELLSDVPWPVAYELRGELRERAGDLIQQQPVLKATCDADGEFRFVGLPPSWSGRLRLPHRFVFAPDVPGVESVHRRDLLLDWPQTDLELGVRRLRHVTGRVLEAGGIQPVPGAIVEGILRRGNRQGEQGFLSISMNLNGLQIRADENGFFEIPILGDPRFRSVSVSLYLSRPDGTAQTTYHFGPEPTWQRRLPEDGMLGDLELVATREVPFIVWDTRGQPIPGAYAITGEGEGTGGPTDQLGSGVVHSTTFEETVLRVGKLGYEPVAIAIPAGEISQPIEVTLSRGTLLDVRLMSNDHGLGRSASVKLSFPPGLFQRLVERRTWFERPDETIELSGGARITGGSRGDDGKSVTLMYDDDGHCQIGGLVPDHPFEVSVFANGVELGRHESEGLAAGEHREIEIPVPTSTSQLRGRVTDEEGSPIRGASVVPEADRPGDRALTDAEGRFVLEPLFASRYRLTVRCEGYRDLVIEEQPVTDEPLDLVLERE